MIRPSAIVVCSILVLVACDEEPTDKVEFIESVEVEGTCKEDHATVSSEYDGCISQWYNVTKGKHDSFGFVFRKDSIASSEPPPPEELIDSFLEEQRDPYTYRPPLIITFRGLRTRDFVGDQLTLKGVSDHNRNADGKGPYYWTTCELKVVRRLDHPPEDEEESGSCVP